MDPDYSVPEGFFPPLATVTPDDHAAWIYIAAILGLCCFMVFTGVRLLVRVMFTGSFDNDDYLYAAATGVAIIQTGIILGACSNGLGRSVSLLTPEDTDNIQQMYYTSNFFFIIAITLSKMSVVAFLNRISRMKSHRLVFNVTICILAAYAVGCIFALAFQCEMPRPWITLDAKCPGVLRRWQVICALDIVTEVAIVGLVVYLVFALKSPLSSKITVVYIFSFRLVMIVFIAFRIHTFDSVGYTTDPSLLNAPFISWTQSELAVALITATIPTFRNFLNSLHTGFGGMGVNKDGQPYGYSGYGNNSRAGKNTTGQSFQMSKLRSNGDSNPASDPEEDPEPHFTPQIQPIDSVDPLTGREGGSAATAHWSAGTRGSDAGINNETASIGSDESRRMIIRKQVNWTVKTEPR